MAQQSLFNAVIYCGVSLEAVTGINPPCGSAVFCGLERGDGRTVRALGEPSRVSGAGSGPSGFPSIRRASHRGNSCVLQEPRILRWVGAPLGSVQWAACLSEPWVPASQSEMGCLLGTVRESPGMTRPTLAPVSLACLGAVGKSAFLDLHKK